MANKKVISQVLTGIGQLMWAKRSAGTYGDVVVRDDINTITLTSTRNDVRYYGSDRLVISDTSVGTPGATFQAPPMTIADILDLIDETDTNKILSTNGLVRSKRLGIKFWLNLRAETGFEKRYFFVPEAEISFLINMAASTQGETVTFQDEVMTVEFFTPPVEIGSMKDTDTFMVWDTLGRTASDRTSVLENSFNPEKFDWVPGDSTL